MFEPDTATGWPDGVIARYLTTAGATVDLNYESRSGLIHAVCTGEQCGWTEHTDTEGRVSDTPDEERARFEQWAPAAKRRAQSHAEACRALPKPKKD